MLTASLSVLMLCGCTGPERGSDAAASEAVPTGLTVAAKAALETKERPGEELIAQGPPSAGSCSKAAGRVPTGENVISMGVIDGRAILGKAGELVCSEPGQNGVGECELAANASAYVKEAGTVSVLTAGTEPTRIWYGPKAVSCSREEAG